MAADTGYFGVKSISLSSANGGKPCTLHAAAAHILRETQAEKGSIDRINPALAHLNIVMCGDTTAADVQVRASALVAASDDADKLAGKKALRRDHCQAIEAVFSIPKHGLVPDVAAYFADCVAWVARTTRLPVLVAVAHHDEAQPHLHIILAPVVDGVRVGSKAVIGGERFKFLRESFFTEVACRHGLKRQGAKLTGVAKQWADAALLAHCEAEGLPQALGALWPFLRAGLEAGRLEALTALGLTLEDVKPLVNPWGTAPEKSIDFTAPENQVAKDKPKGALPDAPRCEVNPVLTSQSAPSPAPSTAPAQAPNDSAVAPAPAPAPAAAPSTRPAPSNVIHWPTTPTPTPTEPDFVETTVRVRDDQYTPEQFDCDSGEFVLPSAPRPRRRDATDAAVALALAALHHRPRMAC